MKVQIETTTHGYDLIVQGQPRDWHITGLSPDDLWDIREKITVTLAVSKPSRLGHDEMFEMASKHVRAHLGDYLRYDDKAVRADLEEMNDDQLSEIMVMNERQLAARWETQWDEKAELEYNEYNREVDGQRPAETGNV